MGPGVRFRPGTTARSRNALHAPPYDGTSNPLEWARRVSRWERLHDSLCASNHRSGMPASARGFLLSEALSGTALRTVESSIAEDIISSEQGTKAILAKLVRFNPTTYAHDVFTAYKATLRLRRNPQEPFKLYVNRFEAAVEELRSLTGQEQGGEAEQLLAYALLEGAQVSDAVFMQLLGSCASQEKEATSRTQAAKAHEAQEQLTKLIDTLRVKSEEAERPPSLEAAIHGLEAPAKQKVLDARDEDEPP